MRMAEIIYEGELVNNPQNEKIQIQLTSDTIFWQLMKFLPSKKMVSSSIEITDNQVSSSSTSTTSPPKSMSFAENMVQYSDNSNASKDSFFKRNSLKTSTSTPKPPVIHAIHIKDIVGCEAARGPDKKHSTCFLRLYTYPSQKTFFSKVSTRRRKEVLWACDQHKTFAENHEEVKKWEMHIKKLLLPFQEKELLVLINPYGGSGKAIETFQFYAKPILAEACMQYQCIKTEYAGHAQKLARELELDKWAGVVVVSGDGLIHEVLNGLLEHAEPQKALKTPIGVIPAGSGNALAASLLFQAGESYKKNLVQTTCLMLSKYQLKAMDVVLVEMPNQPQKLSFLSVAWGIISDVDIESENFRALGKARFTVGTLNRLIKLRKYSGRLSFLPVDPSYKSKFLAAYKSPSVDNLNNDKTTMSDDIKNDANQANISDVSVSTNNNVVESNLHNGDEKKLFTDGFHSSNDNQIINTRFSKEITTSTISSKKDENLINNTGNSNNNHSAPSNCESNNKKRTSLENSNEETQSDIKSHLSNSLMNPISEEVPSNWSSVEGDDFISVLALYQSHLGQDMLLLPSSKLDDHVIYLVVIKGSPSRTRILRYFTSLENGSFCDLQDSFTEVFKVRAFRIEPYQNVVNGIMAVDGERVEYGTIQGQVQESLVRVFSF